MIEGGDWVRIRFWRTALGFFVPVAVLSVASGALFFAVDAATPETFDRIHFWFYFFDVGREINVPTWFSSGMWLIAAVLTGVYAARSSRYRISWWVFSVVCVVFSIDEMLELHERLDVIGHELSVFLPFDLGFVWVIPGAVIALSIVAFLLRLIISLPTGVRNGLLLAGLVFISGALGVETLAGLTLASDGVTPAFFVFTLLEETLEMVGIALCLAALLHLIEYRPSPTGGTTYRLATKTPRAARRQTAAAHRPNAA
ncbi:hypothetical protein GCM10027404_33230 [Arthrobacter tumbae]|uniref:hypothetical protein n=1 Tax=Arthrobacter tumbae TaxID=163874 RepID=UPI00195B3058|nr:hypothetical protein [Arthrobacter tumbae]MBM7781801.1 hypothetical protein [Arthrobacter tumbae]